MTSRGTRRMRTGEPPMPEPVGFFLTWTTYGTWLPGDERGWVWKGKGLQLPNPVYRDNAAALMTEPPCTLDDQQRKLVNRTVVDHCRIRGWQLHIVNCRTNHVHVVVSGNRAPDVMREQFKAWCTRRLKERQRSRNESLRENWWTERGSDRCLGDEESLEAAFVYVRDCQ